MRSRRDRSRNTCGLTRSKGLGMHRLSMGEGGTGRTLRPTLPPWAWASEALLWSAVAQWHSGYEPQRPNSWHYGLNGPAAPLAKIPNSWPDGSVALTAQMMAQWLQQSQCSDKLIGRERPQRPQRRQQ